MSERRLLFYNDARHYHLYCYEPPISIEDARAPVDEIAGTKVKHEIDGQSLANVFLNADKGDPDRTLIFVRREGNRRYQGRAYYAIRRGPWKLLQNNPFEPMKLVNLEKDPGEEKTMPSEANIANELQRTLMDHIQKAGTIPWQNPAR